MSGWIGVDLDGTLAHYTGMDDMIGIGDPIPAMLERVKKWIDEGKEVRIFTARVGDEVSKRAFKAEIEVWCLKHIGKIIPVTATKDFSCIEIWDDRCVKVEMNTGRILSQ